MGTSRRRTPPAPVYAEPPKGARTAYRGTQKTSESLFGFKNESQNFFYWHTTTLDGERDRPRPHRPALSGRVVDPVLALRDAERRKRDERRGPE